MQRILDEDKGKFLLAYRVKDNDEIRRGLPVYVDRRTAEEKAEELVENIDVIIKCWVEEK